MNMFELLKKILDAIIEFFKYKELKEELRSDKLEKVKDLENVTNKKILEKEKEVNETVNRNDIDSINAIINRSIMIIFSLIILNGCITKYVPVYVEEDEKVVYMVNNGKEGFWVPQQTMKKLLMYKVKWESYLEAKQNVISR